MDAATFVAGFASCLSLLLFLLSAALLLHITRHPQPVRPETAGGGNDHRIEMFSTRIPAHLEMQVVKLLLDGGYMLDSVRAANGGSRVLDITAHKYVTR